MSSPAPSTVLQPASAAAEKCATAQARISFRRPNARSLDTLFISFLRADRRPVLSHASAGETAAKATLPPSKGSREAGESAAWMKPAVAGGTAPFNGRLHGRCTRGLSKARIAMKTNKMDGALRRKLSAVLHLSNAERACLEAMHNRKRVL